MALLMLIHDEDPGPGPDDPPERAAWEPNWRLWAWFAVGAVATVASFSTEGLVSFLLLCAAFACAGEWLGRAALPRGRGMRDYRQ